MRLALPSFGAGVLVLAAMLGPDRSPLVCEIEMLAASAGGQEQGTTQRDFSVSARRYSYAPARIEVQQDDLVRITLRVEDIAHSFTVDAYRIAKRASPGQPIVFEFRADQAGTFPIYCNLAADEGCRQMRGELVVRGR